MCIFDCDTHCSMRFTVRQSVQWSLSVFYTHISACSICCVSPPGGSMILTPLLLNQHNLLPAQLKTHLTCISGTVATDTPNTNSVCPANRLLFSPEEETLMTTPVIKLKFHSGCPQAHTYFYEAWSAGRYFEDKSLQHLATTRMYSVGFWQNKQSKSNTTHKRRPPHVFSVTTFVSAFSSHKLQPPKWPPIEHLQATEIQTL